MMVPPVRVTAGWFLAATFCESNVLCGKMPPVGLLVCRSMLTHPCFAVMLSTIVTMTRGTAVRMAIGPPADSMRHGPAMGCTVGYKVVRDGLIRPVSDDARLHGAGALVRQRWISPGRQWCGCAGDRLATRAGVCTGTLHECSQMLRRREVAVHQYGRRWNMRDCGKHDSQISSEFARRPPDNLQGWASLPARRPFKGFGV